MLHVSDVYWGRYMQISVSRGTIHISLSHRNRETALLYHFVTSISPFLAIESLPRYLTIKPTDIAYDGIKTVKGKVSIQYELRGIKDFNTMTMPSILIILLSEVDPTDLNARTTSGDEYYGQFERNAIRFRKCYLLIPPRTVLGHSQQLDIEDLFFYDGVQFIRSYHDTQAISALKAIMYAYNILRLRLAAMQKKVIEINETLVEQHTLLMQRQGYNELDFCEDSCMRQASANAVLHHKLENSDDIRTYVENEHIYISPIQRRYLYHMDYTYEYLNKTAPQHIKLSRYPSHSNQSQDPLWIPQPELESSKKLANVSKNTINTVSSSEKPSEIPSLARIDLNLRSVYSNVQALAVTSVHKFDDIDYGTNELITVTNNTDATTTLSPELHSYSHSSYRSETAPPNLQRNQLSTSHMTSVIGLASAVHAFEDPFDPQSSVYNRATSVRPTYRPAHASTLKHLSTEIVAPLANTNSACDDTNTVAGALAKLTSTSTSTERTLITSINANINSSSQIDYTAVSASDMNKYNATLLDLHLRISIWEELDIYQRIILIKDMIRLLYLPDYCPICYRDKSTFGTTTHKSVLPADLTSIYLGQYSDLSTDGESIEEALAVYREEFSAKKLLKDPKTLSYQYPVKERPMFAVKNKLEAVQFARRNTSKNSTKQLPSILSQSPLGRCASISANRSRSQYARSLSPLKSHRAASVTTQSVPNFTPDPTTLPVLPTSTKSSSTSLSVMQEKRNCRIDKLNSQKTSFLTYCRLSSEYVQYVPIVKELLMRYIDTASTTTSFEVEASAHYCTNCGIFIGCCKTCASAFIRSHQADCATFVAFKIFSRMNDRQLEDCCRFEEDHSGLERAKIGSFKATVLREKLANFDRMASEDLKNLQAYIDEKPKVIEGESDIIKDYREQQLGKVSYTDTQINFFRQYRDVMVEKVQFIIEDKQKRYGGMKDFSELIGINEEMSMELTKALTNNDPAAIQHVLRDMLEKRRHVSDNVVTKIKDMNSHEVGQERGLEVFFTHLIDLLRSQYQHNLDELYLQQEQAAHERFLAVSADLRLCSLLEILKQDILGITGKLSQQRFNPIISNESLNSSRKKQRQFPMSSSEMPNQNVYSLMMELASSLLLKQQSSTRRGRISPSRSSEFLKVQPHDYLTQGSYFITDSIIADSDAQLNFRTKASDFDSERSTIVSSPSASDYPVFETGTAITKAMSFEKKSGARLSMDNDGDNYYSRRKTVFATDRNISASHLQCAPNSFMLPLTQDTIQSAHTIDPYHQLLTKQLPRHLQQTLGSSPYLGFRPPNSTVTVFHSEIYNKIRELKDVTILFMPSHVHQSPQNQEVPQTRTFVATHEVESTNSDDDITLGYEELTYNSIYMIQPDIVEAVSELQKILGQSELLYEGAAAILTQYSAQVRLQHKITQMKSVIKKELYSTAKAARRWNRREEPIKISNQEVEYAYIKRYGYDIRKFIFSFPKNHSELLYSDVIESMKAIMDSLSPLYQYTQVYLSKTHSSVQKFERIVKDKRRLLKKVTENLDRILSTRRTLSELVLVAEIQLRQRQSLFEKVLSSSPSPNREKDKLGLRQSMNISLPRLSINDLQPVSSAVTSSTCNQQITSSRSSLATSINRSLTRSVREIHSQGMTPKSLGNEKLLSSFFNHDIYSQHQSIESSDIGVPFPNITISQKSLQKPYIESSTTHESPKSVFQHQVSAFIPSKNQDTRSDVDIFHSSEIRTIVRRMRRGGKQMTMTTKKPQKARNFKECSDYEFSPEDMLGLSSITVPSDRLQKDISTTGERVDMSECSNRKFLSRVQASFSRQTLTDDERRRALSANEILNLYESNKCKSSPKSSSGKGKRGVQEKRRTLHDLSRKNLNKGRKELKLQETLNSLKELWKSDNHLSPRKLHLFSSSSDTELSTLTVVSDVTNELNYLELINPPISDLCSSPLYSGTINDISETTMQIQRDLHKLGPSTLPGASLRKARTNIPPRSSQVCAQRSSSRAKPCSPSSPGLLPTSSQKDLKLRLYNYKKDEENSIDLKPQSILESLGSHFFSRREISDVDEVFEKVDLEEPLPFESRSLSGMIESNKSQEIPETQCLPEKISSKAVTEDLRTVWKDLPSLPPQSNIQRQTRTLPFSPARSLEDELKVKNINFEKMNLSGLYRQQITAKRETFQQSNGKATLAVGFDPVPSCIAEEAFQSSINKLNKMRFQSINALKLPSHYKEACEFDMQPAQQTQTPQSDNSEHRDHIAPKSRDNIKSCRIQHKIVENYKKLYQTYAHKAYGPSSSVKKVAKNTKREAIADKVEKNQILEDPIKLLAKLPAHSKIVASPHQTTNIKTKQDSFDLSSSDSFEISAKSTAESSTTLIGVTTCARSYPELIISNQPNTVVIDSGIEMSQNVPERRKISLHLLDLTSDSFDSSEMQQYRLLTDNSLSPCGGIIESNLDKLTEATVYPTDSAYSLSTRAGNNRDKHVIIPSLIPSTQNKLLDDLPLSPPPPPPSSHTSTSRKVQIINLPGIPIFKPGDEAATLRKTHLISISPARGSLNKCEPVLCSISNEKPVTENGYSSSLRPSKKASIQSLINIDSMSHADLQIEEKCIDSYNRFRLGQQIAKQSGSSQSKLSEVIIDNIERANSESDNQTHSLVSIYDIYAVVNMRESNTNYANIASLAELYDIAHYELTEYSVMLDLFIELIDDVYLTETPSTAFKQLLQVRNDLFKYRSHSLHKIKAVMAAQGLEIPQCSNHDFVQFNNKLTLFKGNHYPFNFNNYAISWYNLIAKYAIIMKHLDFLIANCLHRDIRIIDVQSLPHTERRIPTNDILSKELNETSPVPRFNFKELASNEKRMCVGIYSLSGIL